MPRLGFFVQGGYGRPGLNVLKNQFDTYYPGGLRLSWALSDFIIPVVIVNCWMSTTNWWARKPTCFCSIRTWRCANKTRKLPSSET